MIFAQTHSFAEKRADGLWSRHDTPQMELGEAFNAQRDNLFTTYIRYGEDVGVGDFLTSRYDLLSISDGTALDGALAVGTKEIKFAATSTLNTILSDGLFEDDYDLKELRGHAVLTVVNGTTLRSAVVIGIKEKRLDVIWLTEAGTLDVAFADHADTKLDMQAPWIYKKAGATDTVNAIAQVSGKKKNFGLVLYCGIGRIKANAAIARGAPIYPTAGGEGDDEAGGTQPEPPIATAITAATAADQLIWANINCKPISKIPFQADPFLRGTKRPGE